MADNHKWKEVVLDSGEVWNKEAPIEGKLLKTEQEVGPNKSKMYTLETDNGEVKVWGSTVLDDKLMGVPEGTYIKIDYEGKLKSKKGTEYHSYKVFIDEQSLGDGYAQAKAVAAALKGEAGVASSLSTEEDDLNDLLPEE
jgi:hypothetical protein